MARPRKYRTFCIVFPSLQVSCPDTVRSIYAHFSGEDAILAACFRPSAHPLCCSKEPWRGAASRCTQESLLGQTEHCQDCEGPLPAERSNWADIATYHDGSPEQLPGIASV
ncbi:hypothetical protein Bbelb_386950 [Branchiostoma belcheri]|nr:hypothetical protein Bbelb_386950 [Branchiostoma belcheri]